MKNTENKEDNCFIAYLEKRNANRNGNPMWFVVVQTESGEFISGTSNDYAISQRAESKKCNVTWHYTPKNAVKIDKIEWI